MLYLWHNIYIYLPIQHNDRQFHFFAGLPAMLTKIKRGVFYRERKTK